MEIKITLGELVSVLGITATLISMIVGFVGWHIKKEVKTMFDLVIKDLESLKLEVSGESSKENSALKEDLMKEIQEAKDNCLKELHEIKEEVNSRINKNENRLTSLEAGHRNENN